MSRIAREGVVHQPEEGIFACHVNFKMTAALCREYFRTGAADYEKLLGEIGRHLKAKGFAGFSYRLSS